MKRLSLQLTGLLALFALLPTAQAADHRDGPSATSNKDADINDLYAWTDSGGQKVNLVMTFNPAAPTGTLPSDAVLYVFHLNSKQTFTATASTEVRIICGFDAQQTISCWAGDSEYVTGKADAAQGLSSTSGKLKVFAGLRNDPFFFNIPGFAATVGAVKSAASSLTFDTAGCPKLDSATSNTLVTQLRTGANGAAPTDTFAGTNTLAIVVQVDKSLVTPGGPILGVWASTHRR
ncbi:DUF4331 family protein [Hyalangium minutum]|uniref:Lipoprotein n=1 Tax=Hyalangium minutum TaxID=394096 RepID=A0A085WMN6_9BACT|nr:hypothetical protein DB31_6851 [Hyalangium minutum]